MDVNAFRSAALAPGRIAEAVGQNVGGVFEDISQKIQANTNARMVFDADLAMRTTKDDFTASLHQKPDEGTWLPEWRDKVQTLQQTILDNPKAGPAVKRALEQKFAVWDAATSAEIRTAALLKGVKETRESAIADATYAAHQGDLEGAQNTLKAAVAHYAMDEADAKKIGSRFPSIAAQAQADIAISTNPIEAPKLVEKYKDVIEPRVYVGVMAHANEARNRAQATNTNDLAMQIDQSPDGTIDPDLIRGKVKAGEITQRAADGLLARMQKKGLDEAKTDFSVAMMEAHDHDFTQDKKPEETARSMKDDYAHLPEPLRLRLYKSIDNAVKQAQTKAEKEERPVERQIFDQMREDRTQYGFTVPAAIQKTDPNWWQRNVLGRKATESKVSPQGGLDALRDPTKFTDDQLKALYGPTVTREQVIRAEQAHYAEIQGKMREWFADPANKKATYDQANEYRIQLEKPFVLGAVSQTLKPQKQIEAQPGKRVRQNGVTYEFDGKDWKPVK